MVDNINISPTIEKRETEEDIDKRMERNCDGDCGDCVYTECIHSIR